MQDRMIDEINEDIWATQQALANRKNHARLGEAEAEERRAVRGNKRYTPPKKNRG